MVVTYLPMVATDVPAVIKAVTAEAVVVKAVTAKAVVALVALHSVVEMANSVAAVKTAIRMHERMVATECVMLPSPMESERQPSPGGRDTRQGKHQHRDQ